MRAPATVALAIVAAAVGVAGSLAVVRETNWLDEAGTTTVQAVVTGPGAAATAPARTVARPLVGGGFDPAGIYADRSPGVVTIFSFFGPHGAADAFGGQGSGFVVSADGTILTNSHVITNAGESSDGSVRAATRVYVEFQDRDRVPATVVGWDVFDDVGVVKVDPKAHALTPLPLGDSSRVLVGEPVAAIGSPFGNENSLAVGVVSATRRSIDSLTSQYSLVDAIQIDAPINHGNSGGPLFDADGDVIGINAQIRSESGNAEGVSFAVPINSARRSLRQLLAGGRVRYAFVGIKTEDLTPTIASRFGYDVAYGAVIESVEPGSAGERAGLRGGTSDTFVNGRSFTRGGDVIVAIDGRAVRASEDVLRIVTERLVPGQTAKFELLRGSRRLTVPVKVDERPAPPARE